MKQNVVEKFIDVISSSSFECGSDENHSGTINILGYLRVTVSGAMQMLAKLSHVNIIVIDTDELNYLRKFHEIFYPSEDLFKKLARYDPKRLVALISSNILEPHHLTFAAEMFGHTNKISLNANIGILISLTNHQVAHVREGALLGLVEYVTDPATDLEDLAIKQVKLLMDSDPNSGVRSVAKEIWQDINEARAS